ncbi:hypothetical protein ACIBEK_05625 [Nocardia fusca]|uniref:hypothetical protein n=1 Tax=Nocardia fusca TaxID=941183 RepID=UPI00378DCD60
MLGWAEREALTDDGDRREGPYGGSEPGSPVYHLSPLAIRHQRRDAQFDDPDSVQICKLGWGAAVMHTAAPDSGHLPWVRRMGEWFVRRQRPDGAWAPSPFLVPEPGVLDLFWKTAEHL